MKKRILLGLALALVLALCACTESEIACGVDGENRAFLRCDLELDLTELGETDRSAVRGWVRKEAFRMNRDQGFSVDTNASEPVDRVWLKAELTRPGKDRAEALDLLRQILTDETLTPFTAAGADSLVQADLETYRLQVRLEPGRVLETLGLEQYPKRLREQMETWLDAATLRLSLTLPATEPAPDPEAALADGLATRTWTLPLRGAEEAALSTVYYTGAGENNQVWWRGEPRTAPNAETLAQTMETEAAALSGWSRTLLLAALGLGALALIFFLWGTVRALRRR